MRAGHADHVALRPPVTRDERVTGQGEHPRRHLSVYNALDVLGAALALGIALAESAGRAGHASPGVKGRVEVVPTPARTTPSSSTTPTPRTALENVLTVRAGLRQGPRSWRCSAAAATGTGPSGPKMGTIACGHRGLRAWSPPITPATEEPRRHHPAISWPGMEGSKTALCRGGATGARPSDWRLEHAQAGDVIVLCGKGHETYQEVNHVKHHMDEREDRGGLPQGKVSGHSEGTTGGVEYQTAGVHPAEIVEST